MIENQPWCRPFFNYLTLWAGVCENRINFIFSDRRYRSQPMAATHHANHDRAFLDGIYCRHRCTGRGDTPATLSDRNLCRPGRPHLRRNRKTDLSGTGQSGKGPVYRSAGTAVPLLILWIKIRDASVVIPTAGTGHSPVYLSSVASSTNTAYGELSQRPICTGA